MQYLKNLFNIDFEKNHRRNSIQQNTNGPDILTMDHLFRCHEIEKYVVDLISEKSIENKKLRIKEQFHIVNTDAERETEETLSYVNSKVANFYISAVEYIWLKNVISSVENIPICITIATARKEYFGFPLIYVNKQFEKTTEYDRKDILGKNCKFLQPSIPIMEEEIQYRLLKSSTQLGLVASIIITNIKKSGKPFYNLVTLNPIKDKHGNYIYMIGIQMEITNSPITDENVKNIIDLMHLLSKIKINVLS
uniref:PAC domain-containing protein n=1 Tax=viral metagenome TaxID=1070528 RepID=A0A6C0B6P1_9ZZZZ